MHYTSQLIIKYQVCMFKNFFLEFSKSIQVENIQIKHCQVEVKEILK